MVDSKSIVDPNLLHRAVSALLKHHNDTSTTNDDDDGKTTSTSAKPSKSAARKDLLGNEESIHVQLSLMRIPDESSITSRPIRIDIPHSLNKLNADNKKDDGDDDNDDSHDDEDDLEEAEICLIVKDASKPKIQTLLSQFPSQMSYIKKVMSLTSLRKKYSPSYAERRQLQSSYNLFLVDDSILPMVGKLLGKGFFASKKQPVPVKVGRINSLPFVVEKCVKSTFLMGIGGGTCLSVKAASTAMKAKAIEENIQSVIQNVIPYVPRKLSNVASISIKTNTSVALPIYNKVREELDEIAKLANVNVHVKDNIKGKKAKVEKNAKKRSLDDDDAAVAAAEEKEDRNKKQKKDDKQKEKDKLKSPLLKALKKKQKEDKGETDAKEEIKNKKKNKKKRTTSDADANDVDMADSSEKLDPASKKKKKTLKVKEDDAGGKEMTPKKKTKAKSKPAVDDVSTPPRLEEDEKKNTDSKAKTKATTPEKDFIASKKFKGAKKGYVFRAGKSGVGYYVDVKPVPNQLAMEALLRSAGGGKKSKNSRRQSTGGKMQKKGRRSSSKGRRASY